MLNVSDERDTRHVGWRIGVDVIAWGGGGRGVPAQGERDVAAGAAVFESCGYCYGEDCGVGGSGGAGGVVFHQADGGAA